MPEVLAPPATPELAKSNPHSRRYTGIRPGGTWSSLDLREMWEFRDLLFALASRDLKLRYKQTALGVIWVILQPLMAAGIFSFVFGKVAKMPSSGVPYFLFSYAGLLGWNLFNNTVTKIATCLVGNAQLLSKVYFPRLILPLSNVPSVLVDFAVAAGMLGVMMAANHRPPPILLLLLPFWGSIIVILALGGGLISASLSVAYRDIQYILPVALQMLLYGCPIAYSASVVPERYRLIYYLNPLSAPLEAFRSSLLGTPMPSAQALTFSSVVSLICLALGLYSFKRLERTFADVI